MGKCRENKRKAARTGKIVTVGRAESVPPGRGATVQLKNGTELALYNVNGEFFAIENFCPHKGYPLADSKLFGGVVECNLHRWRFDVRTGQCLTAKSCSLENYKVEIIDGWIKVHI